MRWVFQEIIPQSIQGLPIFFADMRLVKGEQKVFKKSVRCHVQTSEEIFRVRNNRIKINHLGAVVDLGDFMKRLSASGVVALLMTVKQTS